MLMGHLPQSHRRKSEHPRVKSHYYSLSKYPVVRAVARQPRRPRHSLRTYPLIQDTEELLALVGADEIAAACGSRRLGLDGGRSEEHTSELQSPMYLVC